MKKPYQIVTRAAKESAAIVEQFCQANGQILLPIVNLIESASQEVSHIMHQIQMQTLETILMLSAEQLAGTRTPGKPSGEIRWHGRQAGKIKLADREVKVKRPRLRHKTEGEVKIPAYQRLRQDRGLGQYMLGALMRGVSTREYDEVLPQMAETVGVSRSSVSRQAIEASAEQLKTLREKRWDTVEILVIYIDGQRFGAHHILSAVGVDREGRKHILGIEAGATENAASVKRLLTHLRDQGLPTDRQYLFVIDGAKALRAAIDEVFGTAQHVQRCRNHKLRNVLDELPEHQQGQTLNLMRAAWKVTTAEEGEKRLEQLARFLERDHESAARSLREGMAEMFTLQRLKLPPSLFKCLATTNIIESPQGGVARRTGNVTRWRDQGMAERWVASAWLLTEKHFRRIDGHRDLWALAAILGREESTQSSKEEVA
ncbi:MAG TPA: IS256 family transposase [Longimicrobiales bacterium]|nr:IS256 family transposase [Longimicrobiales bacterium]